MGTKANMKYRLPPSTAPHTAIFSVREDCTRWNTSCCGIEPNIMVIQAAAKARISLRSGDGQKLNLPACTA